MNPTAALPVLIPAAFIGFGLLRRFQRLVQPQPLDARGNRRLIIRPIILTVMALFILAMPHPASGYLAALLGAAAGAGLAYWSSGHTRFEYGPDGQATRYLPNVWIGGGVFALFALRLLWRMWPFFSGQVNFDAPLSTVAGAGAAAPDMGQFVGSSPLTTGLFLLFVAYSLLVLGRSKGQRV